MYQENLKYKVSMALNLLKFLKLNLRNIFLVCLMFLSLDQRLYYNQTER